MPEARVWKGREFVTLLFVVMPLLIHRLKDISRGGMLLRANPLLGGEALHTRFLNRQGLCLKGAAGVGCRQACLPRWEKFPRFGSQEKGRQILKWKYQPMQLQLFRYLLRV